jgi:hypothetical protein
MGELYGGNWISTQGKNEVGLLICSIFKINSEWIYRLNVKAKTVKILGENLGDSVYDIGFDNDLLAMTPKVQAIRGKINKLDLSKIKNQRFILLSSP